MSDSSRHHDNEAMNTSFNNAANNESVDDINSDDNRQDTPALGKKLDAADSTDPENDAAFDESDNAAENNNGTDNVSESRNDADNGTDVKSKTGSNKDSDKRYFTYKLLHILCIIGFIVFGALFINEAFIQPIRIKNSTDYTRDLYKRLTPSPVPSINNTKPTPAPVKEQAEPTTLPPTPTPDPNRDEYGRLLQFSELLAVNDDVKGWISIPDTTIDYVVVQSDPDNPEYYLDKDINHEYSKAGTLFLDVHSSVEDNSRSLVIYGHNMVSTPEKMFRDLNKYKVDKKNKKEVPDFYKEHPLIKFDTIYQTGEWKIFAVFITNGSDKKEPFFDYTRSYFADASDFLNYVYQIRIRSELNIDCVDITDTDQLLVLSTCSYEVDNYRTVVVARRVREGEDSFVDVDSVTVNKNVLYPDSYYYRYGGKAPDWPETFEEALENGLINWYTPPDQLEEKLNQSAQLKNTNVSDNANQQSHNPETPPVMTPQPDEAEAAN